MSARRTSPDRVAGRADRHRTGRPVRRVIEGRECLPGCFVDDAPVEHFCRTVLGSVAQQPDRSGEPGRFWVEVARDGDERTVALGDRTVIAPDAIPRLVCLLLDAYRLAR